MDDRILREKEFHEKRFGGDDRDRIPALKYYRIQQPSLECFQHRVIQHCKGKRLLEYGCGEGSNSVFWAKHGAIVTGIDISSEGIKKARTIPEAEKYNIAFLEMNAEQLAFDDNTFDIVAGSGILHHLDLPQSLSEIARVLKSDGHVVFYEPMGHNIFVNLYRRLTPHMRTIDEHPIRMNDIEYATHYFTDIQAEFFHLFDILAVPFFKTRFFSPVRTPLQMIDRALMKLLPCTKRFAWLVVLDFRYPRKK